MTNILLVILIAILLFGAGAVKEFLGGVFGSILFLIIISIIIYVAYSLIGAIITALPKDQRTEEQKRFDKENELKAKAAAKEREREITRQSVKDFKRYSKVAIPFAILGFFFMPLVVMVFEMAAGYFNFAIFIENFTDDLNLNLIMNISMSLAGYIVGLGIPMTIDKCKNFNKQKKIKNRSFLGQVLADIKSLFMSK